MPQGTRSWEPREDGVGTIATNLTYDDIGFPSVCYENVFLPLVIKEAVPANGLVESRQVASPHRDMPRK